MIPDLKAVDSATGDALASVVNRLALIIALAVVVVLPMGHFFQGYGSEAHQVQVTSDIKADMIMAGVITSAPDLWPYQVQRLEGLLQRHTVLEKHDSALIRDAAGTVLVRVGAPLGWPMLRRSSPLYESGRLVGRVEVERSLHTLTYSTALAAVVGLLLGGTFFMTLRILPLRALRRATDALFEEKERAEVTLHSIGDGVITTDAAARVGYLNPVAERLTGWPLDAARGRPLTEVLRLSDETTMQSIDNPLSGALTHGKVASFDREIQLLRRDGLAVSIECTAAPIRDPRGTIVGGVIVFHDVSVARTLAHRLSWQATHDALTGLVNRGELENRIDAAFASARNSGKQHVLCCMDLDQFKVVNDTCGHAAGDELLKQLAVLLQSKIRKSDTLARIGGDEFALLLDGCPLDRGRLIANDLLAAVRDFRFHWEGKAFTVGLSAGIVVLSADGKSAAEVLGFADTACYWAKEQGRNRVCVYRHGDSEIVDRHRQMGWVARIQEALDQNRFTLYYQSYLDLSGKHGPRKHIEVLLRMIDEQGGIVLPGSFLPAAERYNLMPEIDRWVVGTVFAAYHELERRLGDGDLTCGINLSGSSLNAEGFFDFIRRKAEQHRLPRHSICFEITETAAINNLRKVAEFMKEIQALGFLFALDDFGSGTSSFGYLKNLPVDYLKIDGGFVKDLERDPVDRAMTETINRIGHIMKVKTVAEFAETDAIVQQLKAMGVDYAQGYGVSKPEPLIGPAPVAGASQRPVVVAGR